MLGLDLLRKIKFLEHFRIVKVQVPSSGEETGCRNYIVVTGIHRNGATLQIDTSSQGFYQHKATRSYWRGQHWSRQTVSKIPHPAAGRTFELRRIELGTFGALDQNHHFSSEALTGLYRYYATHSNTSESVDRDGDRFNSCQVIFLSLVWQFIKTIIKQGVDSSNGPKTRLPLFDFHKRILFSDEAHIWLNGFVNKQNCRIWSEANPQVYVETPLHPEKTDCLVDFYGLVESFFKNDEGHNVTVNDDRYRAIITNFFIPELNNHDVQELWFQQDGATCHTARATIDLLKDTFGDRLISRFGPVNWPPRSCDLTLLDYFLWSYVKSLVYADKPQTLDHLEDNIPRVIADIRPQMLEKVIENWTSRLDCIRASRGSHMPEIILKM
ncbi:DUF4817 domain-containing protein [Trichonephila clavipes]|nr:DUF4817 domain-containing protein [Trichonephila clavipes]